MNTIAIVNYDYQRKIKSRRKKTKFFLVLTIFCPLTLLAIWKIKKNKKKKLEILSSYTCVLQMTIIYDVQFLRYGAQQNFFCHFEPFFTLLCPATLPKQTRESQFWKNEKKRLDIITLHKCTKNHDFQRYGARQADGQTGGLTEGLTDWQKDWRIDEWTDRRTDGQTDQAFQWIFCVRAIIARAKGFFQK